MALTDTRNPGDFSTEPTLGTTAIKIAQNKAHYVFN